MFTAEFYNYYFHTFYIKWSALATAQTNSLMETIDGLTPMSNCFSFIIKSYFCVTRSLHISNFCHSNDVNRLIGLGLDLIKYISIL